MAHLCSATYAAVAVGKRGLRIPSFTGPGAALSILKLLKFLSNLPNRVPNGDQYRLVLLDGFATPQDPEDLVVTIIN